MQFRYFAPALFVLAITTVAFLANKPNFKSFSKEVIYDTSAPLAIFAKDHKGKNVISSSGVVKFSSGLDNDYYHLDSINRKGHLYLETKLGQFINENMVRVPINLSIVIDHSGSMAGEKLQQAKNSARMIIDNLTADDFVNIVIYDSDVEVIQAATRVLDKNEIKRKIDRINSGSSTNLWGGTERGYELTKGNYKPNAINRVLLISDGLVNTGITSNFEIKRRVQEYKDREGITLSSFGVGLDYNEILMTDMAEAGSGNYYFIDKPDQMASIFRNELNGLLNVAAQNAELKISLPRGVEVIKIFGYSHVQQGRDVTIKFRDLFGDETKGLLMKFKLDDYVNGPLKFISTLTYDDVIDKKRKSLVNENMLLPSEDQELYVTHFNESVLQQTILYTANENMENAMREADQGNFEKARTLMKSNSNYLKSNSTYLSKSVELQVMDSVSQTYEAGLIDAESRSESEIKFMQKSNRVNSYKVRNKKN